MCHVRRLKKSVLKNKTTRPNPLFQLNGNSRTRSASSSSSSPPAKRQKITVAPFAASFPRRTLLSSSRWVNKVPHDIWVYKIFQPFLDLKALSTLGRCNTFFEEYWQYVLKQNIIHVPEGCPTLNQAMPLAVVFTERNECTRENPVQVKVGEGIHKIMGDSLYSNLPFSFKLNEIYLYSSLLSDKSLISVFTLNDIPYGVCFIHFEIIISFFSSIPIL